MPRKLEVKKGDHCRDSAGVVHRIADPGSPFMSNEHMWVNYRTWCWKEVSDDYYNPHIVNEEPVTCLGCLAG